MSPPRILKLTGSSLWNHGGLCVREAASDQLTSCLRRGWAEQRPSVYKRAHYLFSLLIRESGVAEFPGTSKGSVTHMIPHPPGGNTRAASPGHGNYPCGSSDTGRLFKLGKSQKMAWSHYNSSVFPSGKNGVFGNHCARRQSLLYVE